ncbi:uncharacterized protein [Nicotiana tomentosiformis]|uniref:uncharacterized protein n=1 Tax=Nicotiana tomentosiformis TaxID=4098 RepID=UPI00388CD732
MTMIATTYRTSHNCSDQLTTHVLVAGFTGQLKGLWDTHLSEEDKNQTILSVRVDSTGEPILKDGLTILDSTNTLIYTIMKIFIGSSDGIKLPFLPESTKNLMEISHIGKKNSKMTYLSILGIYLKNNSKISILVMLFPIIYGQLTSLIQHVALKICRHDKILRQLAKDRIQTRRDLGSLCEQFGLPPCSKKPHKRQTSKDMESTKYRSSAPKFRKTKLFPSKSKTFPSKHKPTNFQTPNSSKFFKCNKPGHIAKYCKLSNKVRNLDVDEYVPNQIEKLLLEDSDISDVADDELEQQFNQLEDDDTKSFSSQSSQEEPAPNILSKEQDLLLEIISILQNSEQKKYYLEQFK